MSYETEHKWDGVAAVESKLKEEQQWSIKFRNERDEARDALKKILNMLNRVASWAKCEEIAIICEQALNEQRLRPCIKCGKEIGNDVFTVCDQCWHLVPEVGNQMEQMTTNFYWMVGQMDAIHIALCPASFGTWQERAKQAVQAARALRPNNRGDAETASVVPIGWSQTPPTEQGWYWHWNGGQDASPVSLCVLMSHTSGKCFVASGQLGIEKAVDCDAHGGWWLPLHEPATPPSDWPNDPDQRPGAHDS